jgi:hypothetical protein
MRGRARARHQPAIEHEPRAVCFHLRQLRLTGPIDRVEQLHKRAVLANPDLQTVAGEDAVIDRSLRRMNTDYIDLFYQHRIDLAVPIENSDLDWGMLNSTSGRAY